MSGEPVPIQWQNDFYQDIERTFTVAEFMEYLLISEVLGNIGHNEITFYALWAETLGPDRTIAFIEFDDGSCGPYAY